jgi:hypothetical protein
LLAFGIGTASAAARGGPAAPLCAHAASAYHAAIVVEHGNGQVVRQCVAFGSATMTALALLQASGIENKTEAYGGLGEAVCQIDNEPVQYTQCLPASGSYWVFFISRGGGAWTNSSQGISNATVGDGDAVGFRYDPLAGADPPPVSPAGTCATTTPTPTPTARPTASPTPNPTPTPAASAPPGGTAPPGAPSQAPVHSSPVATSNVNPVVAENPASPAASSGQPATAAPIATVEPAATISGPVTPGLVLAACVVIALLALLGVDGIRRRRR